MDRPIKSVSAYGHSLNSALYDQAQVSSLARFFKTHTLIPIVRVGASGGSNLKSAAFVNTDGSVAVVIINSGTGAQTVAITLSDYPSVQAWYTDNTHDMSAATVTTGSDGTTSTSVPGRGMISFLFNKAANGTVV